MSKVQCSLSNEQQMKDLAALVARFAYAGDILLLKGTLGMGKSTFARAFIQTLAGKKVTVPSPTFTLVQTYHETRLNVAHVDAYRLQSGDDFEGLDLQDYFEHGITLIEWPENIEEALPQSTPLKVVMMESEVADVLTIEITDGGDDEEDTRLVSLKAEGSWASRFGLMFTEEAESTRDVSDENRRAFLQTLGLQDVHLEPVDGALSCRTYYRLNVNDHGAEKGNLEHSRILMDAPPPMEDVKPFLSALKNYANAGVHVPTVYGEDVQNGYLLLEDFGSMPLSQLADESAQKAWLKACVDVLLMMYHKGDTAKLDVYDENIMFAEASRYVDWYLPYETGCAVPLEERAAFAHLWQKLAPLAVQVPFSLTHWDFHSDNLMKIAEEPCAQNVGVIDFQDSLKGPITFDLCCLLEDRHQKPLSVALKEEIIQYMLEKLDGQVSYEAFMQSYHIGLLHRLFKITGLYNRATKRDGRTGLPWDMEKVWAAIHTILQEPYMKEMKDFVERVDERLALAAS